MAKYTVLVTRTTFAFQEFTVEADNEDLASCIAEQQASDTVWSMGNVEYDCEVTGKVASQSEVSL